MTSTVKNIKVGNTSYPVQDTKATPFLSSTDEATLLSDGTYRGETVANNTIFTGSDGVLKQFTKTIVDPTWLQRSSAWSFGDNFGTGSNITKVATNGTYTLYACGYYNAAYSYYNVASVRQLVKISNNSTIYAPSGAACVYLSSNNTFYYFGRNNNCIWTPGTSTFTAISNPDHVCGDDPRIATNGSIMVHAGYYSYDGQTWGQCNITTSRPTYDTIAHKFFDVLSNGYCYESSDGITWAYKGNTGVSQYLDWLIAYNGILLGYRRNGSANTRLYLSTDGGSTWTTTVYSDVARLGGVCDGLFYLYRTDSGSEFKVSTDAITWKSIGKGTNTADRFENIEGTIQQANQVYYLPTGVQYSYSLTPLSYTASEVNEAIAEIPSWLTGVTDPTTSTKGSVGQRYLNTVSGSTFICSGAEAPIANYTVNGSPTIDSDYVMSGIGASNYITGPSFSWATSTSSKWSMEIEFTTPSTWSERQHLWAIGTADNLGFIYNGTLIMALTAYGVAWNATSYGVALSTSTHYKVKWEYTGSAMNMYVTSTDTYPTTPSVTKAQTGTISAANIFFGCRPSYSTQYFTGSIDLKSIKIYSDGTLVWEAVTENYSWEGLQNKLTAGTNITIDSNNVISATGGGSSASYDATTQEITL